VNFQQLDVFLRGNRDYVQGSQILGRTADWLIQAGHEEAMLIQAKFSQTTQHPVMAFRRSEAEPLAAKDLIGKARYRRDDEMIDIVFANASDGTVPWVGDQPSKREAFTDYGELRGEARIVLDGTQEGYLAAVIETVKALHQSLATDVTDIWFTALSGAALPLAPGQAETAFLKVEPLLTRNHDKRKQTLSEVTVSTEDGVVFRFNIAFSCRIVEP
jgi:hypothetical protein